MSNFNWFDNILSIFKVLIDTQTGGSPDYSQASSWGALPEKIDLTDETPKGLAVNGFITNQSLSKVDVFFCIQQLTPTIKKQPIGMVILQMKNYVSKLKTLP